MRSPPMSSISPDPIVSAAVTMQSDRLQQSLSLAVLKQQQDAEKSVADMVEKAVASAPPPAPGTGRLVDRSV